MNFQRQRDIEDGIDVDRAGAGNSRRSLASGKRPWLRSLPRSADVYSAGRKSQKVSWPAQPQVRQNKSNMGFMGVNPQRPLLRRDGR